MIPAAFEYHAPKTLEEAVALLREHDGEARVLGGGQSLVPMMRLRLAQPAHVVDLSGLDLSGVRRYGSRVGVLAMTTYHQLETSPVVKRALPLLAEACSLIGDRQVRNRGTIGGSLAHADPAADLPAVVLALEGTVAVMGGARRRSIPVERFFQDAYTTALGETEIVTGVVLPVPPRGTGSAYEKFANKASRFAIVGVAALVTLDRRVVCTRVRIGVTGAGPIATRAKAAERALEGKALSAESVANAASRAGRGIEFLADQHASAEYREALLGVVAERALLRAARRAGAEL